MLKKITSIALVCSFLLITSCASILSKSNYAVNINSTPSANISIADRKGVVVYQGTTPTSLKLKSGAGFFKRARYQVSFTKDGFSPVTLPIEFKLDGWYFGNLLIGGVLGMLIIDPATGAMYKLDNEFVNATLVKNVATTNESLKIYAINEIPAEWNNHLQQITE